MNYPRSPKDKSVMPKITHHPEVMKEYSLDKLKLKGRITLSLGDIVSLKALAIRKGFAELAEKLRQEENKILIKAAK